MKPSKKQRKRERRQAERHGLGIESYRKRKQDAGTNRGRKRRGDDPFTEHEAWRAEVDR